MGEASTLAQESPKLLTLDKVDVRAIRSFLPGKVLGRTAALLALVVLVLGFATSVDVGLERFLGFPRDPPWLKPTILFGINQSRTASPPRSQAWRSPHATKQPPRPPADTRPVRPLRAVFKTAKNGSDRSAPPARGVAILERTRRPKGTPFSREGSGLGVGHATSHVDIPARLKKPQKTTQRVAMGAGPARAAAEQNSPWAVRKHISELVSEPSLGWA
jgi:hypothetical protein